MSHWGRISRYATSSKRGDAIKAECVADSSAVLALLFPDEMDATSSEMERQLLRFGAVVPALFRWEIRNALLVAARKSRVTYDWMFTCLDRIAVLPIDVDPIPAKSLREAELDLARRFNLSVYDAAYLELAHRRSIPVMTRDARLGAAAAELSLLWSPR